jgi:hypothetical protein
MSRTACGRLDGWVPFVLGVLLVAVPWPLAATHVNPIFVDGNPSCTSLGYAHGYKVDPPNAGTYDIDGLNTVTVTTDGVSFDWSSTLTMDAVIAKGGPNANVYIYDPPAEAASDTELHSPINPNNDRPFGLSHIEFCFDYEVVVTKDAETSFTRTWRWRIDKSVAPEQWYLFEGDTGTSLYTVAVERTGSTDGDWSVSGTISVHNPAPSTATLQSVTDQVSPAIAAAVDCGGASFPYALGSGETLECTYETALPDGASRTNTATATTTGPVGSGSGSAAVVFGDPTTEVNATVTVNDSNGGSWQFSGSGAQSYARTFACNADQGVHGNVATIVETGQSDGASVSVNCYALRVTKDARTRLDRDWSWTIEKEGDQTELMLMPGQQFLVNYRVSLEATSTDGGWKASGSISVRNEHPNRAATILAVKDFVGDAVGNVSCGDAVFPYLLAPGGTLTCTYTVDLPDGAMRTNVARARLRNFAYAPDGTATPMGMTLFAGTAPVDFSAASVTELDECVDVEDDPHGPLGTLCADAAPGSFEYSRHIGPFADPEDCGDREVVNVASFIAGDTGDTGESSWTVAVEVVCERGCTLTPGYWKTHSRKGPAPYDDTWALLGPAQEDTPFFLSGGTYYEALWTPPKGNAYYILAHAWIATELNGLNGASLPMEVQEAFDEAKTLFETWTPAQIGALKGADPTRKRFLELAGLLDMYNNGLIGPGHCSEEVSR